MAAALTSGLLCRECRVAAPEFERAVSYGVYAGELREMVHLLKFEGVRGVARRLGGRLGEAILALEGEAAPELLVVAVPLFARRQRQRGYNQSVLLADEALRWLRQARPDWRLTAAHQVLVRTMDTEQLYPLSPRQRRASLKGAFAVPGDVRGREVLLVDDILTSGATARECARVLRAAGATRVWVATLCRAQHEDVRRQHEDPGEYVARWDLPPATAGQAL